jgi:hypothetical protein
VNDFPQTFDALPPAEQHQEAAAIRRRSTGSGEIPNEAFKELAAKLFRAYDAEEAAS